MIVDTMDMEIEIDGWFDFQYNGHYFAHDFVFAHNYPEVEHSYQSVGLHCIVCGKDHYVDCHVDELRAWNIALYICNTFDECEVGDVPRVKERIKNDILPKYVGEPDTPQTRKDIKDEIVNTCGVEVTIV